MPEFRLPPAVTAVAAVSIWQASHPSLPGKSQVTSQITEEHRHFASGVQEERAFQAKKAAQNQSEPSVYPAGPGEYYVVN